MNLVQTYSAVLTDIPRRQVLRYLGMGHREDTSVSVLIDETQADFLQSIQCKGCYRIVPVAVTGDHVDLQLLDVQSKHLARALQGCSHAMLFAATIGAEADLLRRRAAVRSAARELVADAVGSAAIESFCDLMCREIAVNALGMRFRPRFSPGYGDLSIDTQRGLLDVLDAGKTIGVRLTDSLLMVPQKSVTAIVGLGTDGCTLFGVDCDDCSRADCEFRR